nr:MAG TPA: hypothetical protein [Bacteriophage sp.]
MLHYPVLYPYLLISCSYHHLRYLLFPDLNTADNKHIISQIPIATDHLKFNPKQIVISFITPHVVTRLNTQLISNNTIVNTIIDNVLFLLFINSLLVIIVSIILFIISVVMLVSIICIVI